ncbi:hypothetical protein [Actinophytocola oryzae]|uniref:Uncharacterized protein n=1 Tax=Actinophytocola oryzae TaxID=502181 RepID=A0A4R7UYU6_9PSEU|nr:hypothetical protein [Actinophytocola oryzae]TDV41374.1 hypothetical protein CLV71_12064 [Actinophytocola oryzae]
MAAPLRLRLGLLASVAGAVLTFLGVFQGLVDDAPPPAFHSMALLLVLACAPAGLAILAVAVGRAPTAAGILTGAAILAPGLALIDAQFLGDALEASRPELMVPTSLAPLTPAAGAYLLLVGHAVTALAGLLVIGRAGADPDSDYYAALDAGTDLNRRAIGWAIAAGAVSVIGLLFSPFSSDNAFVVASDLIASPDLVRYGGLLLVVSVLVGCVAVAVNPAPPLARGMAVGLFAGLSWLVLAQLAAVARVEWLHLQPWPICAIAPIGLLALMLFLTGDLTGDDTKRDVQFEGSPIATGVLGVLTGLATLVASFGSLVVNDIDQPESYANRQLLPAGIVIIVLGAVFFTRWAGVMRPAFVVALGAVPLVGFAALDTAFTATTVGNVIPGLTVDTGDTRVGAAVWFIIVALVFLVVAIVLAAVAGGSDRDEDVDLSKRTMHLRYGLPAGGAVLFALGAFTSPMIKAAGYKSPGILSDFRLASWGLLIGLLVVLGAAVLAAFSRPARAAALLLGAAVVVGIHLLELPMTGGRAADSQAGAGTWLTLACLVALVVAAVAAMTDPNRHTAE